MERQSGAFHWRVPWFVGATAGWSEQLARVARLGLGVLLVVTSSFVIGLATGLISAPTFAAAPPSPVSEVLSLATTWRGPAGDPVIALAPGLPVKSSNYRGVRIGGTLYYYNLAPRQSYDPLARGEVTADQIQVVAVVGDPPNRVMVYSLK
ncbi:MAG TPA: hypothetical protein VIO35_07350 [Chloroflexota bacterium]